MHVRNWEMKLDEGSWAHTCGAKSSLLGLSFGPKLQEGEGDRKREGGRK